MSSLESHQERYNDIVQVTYRRTGLTVYEVFEKTYETEWGAIIDRSSGAMMEADFRVYQAHGHIPQYVKKHAESLEAKT